MSVNILVSIWFEIIIGLVDLIGFCCSVYYVLLLCVLMFQLLVHMWTWLVLIFG